MTKLEKIKGMSVESMAKFISKIHQFDSDNCSICHELLIPKNQWLCGHNCCVETEAKKWLESEVEND